MRGIVHIILGMAFASQAVALTPLPACSGVKIGTYEIWDSRGWDNTFVSYYGNDNATNNAIVVLENCRTGKALWADTFSNNGASEKGDLDDVLETLEVYLDSERGYTMKAIQRGMRAKGFKVRTVRFKDETCVCRVYAPEARQG